MGQVNLKIQEIYQRLYSTYGPQHWWPGEAPFEVMVGAILTQSAAWGNVEKAIHNLKQAGSLSPAALRHLGLKELARLIHPSGYFNAKAQKLKFLASFLGEYGDDLDRLFSQPLPVLREKLLSVHGIGPETADSILLYAGGQPVFVVDAYTRRCLNRLGLAPESKSYAAYQSLFMDNLSREVALFNEFHALWVRHGKLVCRARPHCAACCLSDVCAYWQST